jgi:hypothetical protein
MVAAPDRLCHTIKMGARQHIEANVLSVNKIPHIYLNHNLREVLDR